VTLELASKRSHSTAYGPIDTKRHAQDWRIYSFQDNGVSFWFGFAIRFAAVKRQALQREQRIRMPTPDASRRLNEYSQFFARLRVVDANVPRRDALARDTILGLVYLVDAKEVKLSEDMLLPFGQFPDEFWEPCLECDSLRVVSTGLVVGAVQIALLLGFQ